MLNIELFKFGKDRRSTATPTESGDIFSCLIKSPSSAISPVVELKISNNEYPDYNYAYIGSFNRYYYIDNIIFNSGTWTLFLTSDALASFKDDIKASTQYVARSSQRFNNMLMDDIYKTLPLASGNFAYREHPGIIYNDNLYPGGINYRILSTGYEDTWGRYYDQYLDSGRYVITIVGDNAQGTVNCVFTSPGFKEVLRNAFALTPANTQSIDQGISNALWDPMQYIISVRWYPVIPNEVLSQTVYNTLYLGGVNSINVSQGFKILTIDEYCEFYTEIDLPSHPKAAQYGYMNLSPYRELNLWIPPFGNFPLDTTKLINESKVRAAWIPDFANGIARFKATPTSNTHALLVDTMCEYGVPIPVSTLITRGKEGIQTAAMSMIQKAIPNKPASPGIVSSLFGMATEFLLANENDTYSASRAASRAQDVYNGFWALTDIGKDALSYTTDLLAAAYGSISTTGSPGSFINFWNGKPFVYAFFYDQAETDLQRFGRPLCEKMQLNTLSGFVLCEGARVDYVQGTPTTQEKMTITDALNSGVYLE